MQRLQLSNDGKHVLYQQYTRTPIDTGFNDTQRRLLSFGLVNGSIEHLAKDFIRNIVGHAIDFDGNQLIRGQHTQSLMKINCLVIEKCHERKCITGINDEDNAIIEGILHYPPHKFEAKNLPLFILIHGAASNDWLVLESNDCGSTGYGDQFVDQVRRQPLSRPGRDILAAVDRLVMDEIVVPNRLAVGDYSYGDFMTNWLITQTTRFNAALSGAGSLEHVSAWGTMDLPLIFTHLFGGFPWVVQHLYQNQSVIYQLDRVRTPTHIITGEGDVRVYADRSYILERALHTLGIPVKLLQKYGHQSWFPKKQ
ncbi:unnamed protein product [Rotaria magnacalcarata]|uniref:Peptidase S9 prolyl oligopeptidase catalytic domain-containing protein n=2 Tax=Rotaria magnacalcarata TaxID=392030 RepID=A0A816SFW9_9BILA|nr:unnamed protein product [Rotaria magnacalcarata]